MFEGLLQPTHLLVIAGLALLFFGPKRLPEFGTALGQSVRGLKGIFQRDGASVSDDAQAGTTQVKPLKGLLTGSTEGELKN
jgi:TatA/E family protein of Tat protein translocase